MPSSASEPPSLAAAPPVSTPQDLSRSQNDKAVSGSPVEMETIHTESLQPLPSPEIPASGKPSTAAALSENTPPQSQGKSQSQSISNNAQSEQKDAQVDSQVIDLAPPSTLIRMESDALGPSSDAPALKPDTSNGPVVVITLLLTATGARHPYKIDEKYMKKRNVKVDDMNPFNISVYTLKELIWRDWREEWEPRPTSPSSIRLIHFGRMLDDKLPLKECRFEPDAPNVVHMTVKPQEVVDEEDAKTGKGGRQRDSDEEEHAGCRCVIL